MRQPSPPFPSASSPPGSPLSSPPPSQDPGRRIPKPPTPEELVAHYESQGLDYKEASMKAIQELQGILYRTAISRARGGGGDGAGAPRGRMDEVSARLAVLEAKLDSKPGYPGAVAAGVAAGAVLGSLGHVWRIVCNVAASSSRGGSP